MRTQTKTLSHYSELFSGENVWITPIHNRKGDSRAIPVALTFHIIKLFEKILRKNIVNHMNENDLFDDSQHRFQKDSLHGTTIYEIMQPINWKWNVNLMKFFRLCTSTQLSKSKDSVADVP